MLNETPSQTARREAYEEIGLPLLDSQLPKPFKIHHLCQLPLNLAVTQVGVRPCVAWIEADPEAVPSSSSLSAMTRAAALAEVSGRLTRSMTTQAAPLDIDGLPNVEDVLIPTLDAKEVAAVFTAPFESFLKTHIPDPTPPQSGETGPQDSSTWYTGQWTQWNGGSWRMHNFYVPSSDQPVAWAEPPPTTMTMNRFRVWGMTARILVDAARVAFGREPDFEHNSHLGDEDMIGRLIREGELGDKQRKGNGGVNIVDGNSSSGNKADQSSKM
jgi:hypothetical protein